MNQLWTMLEGMSSSQLVPLSDAASVNMTAGFRPLRESTPGPRGSVHEQGSWELRRDTTGLDSYDRPEQLLDRRRGAKDDRDRNLERGDYRRRDNSQDREGGRRRSQDRDGEADNRRVPSRSRSREPEQPANGAKDLAPATEKEKELERKKSRSPSAERNWSKKQMISALSVLRQLADQQH
jgi:hypothetical protein